MIAKRPTAPSVAPGSRGEAQFFSPMAKKAEAAPRAAKQRRLADEDLIDDPARAVSDAVAPVKNLEARFSELMELRMTEPEKQAKELSALLERAQKSYDDSARELKSQVARLEKELHENKKYKDDLEKERITATKALADAKAAHERALHAESQSRALTKALDAIQTQGMDVDTSRRMLATLDAYKTLFGTALKPESDKDYEYSATFFNTSTKKVVKIRVTVMPESVKISPFLGGNASLLPEEFRNGDVNLSQGQIPAAMTKIISSIAL